MNEQTHANTNTFDPLPSAEAAMQGLEALSNAVNSARDRAQAQQVEIERLRAELAGTQGELEAARAQVEQMGKLEAEIDQLKSKLDESKARIQKMESEANDRAKILREHRAEYKKLAESAKLMHAQNQKMRQDVTRIMQQKGMGGALRQLFGG